MGKEKIEIIGSAPVMGSVGRLIKTTREESGLTQKELAARMGVSPSIVGMWEQDRRRVPEKKLREIWNVCKEALEARAKAKAALIEALEKTRKEESAAEGKTQETSPIKIKKGTIDGAGKGEKVSVSHSGNGEHRIMVNGKIVGVAKLTAGSGGKRVQVKLERFKPRSSATGRKASLLPTFRRRPRRGSKIATTTLEPNRADGIVALKDAVGSKAVAAGDMDFIFVAGTGLTPEAIDEIKSFIEYKRLGSRKGNVTPGPGRSVR